ncbi:MAG TPA: hypothetical protein VH914_00550 [Acidimicrobiia bacterium]|nr:hypothetical protein [Acidimicrobiia bacterium]
MTCNPSPFPLAVLAEATRISPRRRGAPLWHGVNSSDGSCGDATHATRESDHNPDARGIPHAVDISQSTPGAPYWDPKYGLFDAHAYGFEIAQPMRSGEETRVKYLVSFLAGHDVIFDPAVSMAWRENGTGTEHASHLHVSFTVATEQSTAPLFRAAAPPPLPPPPPPTVFTEEIDVELTTYDRTVNPDANGNGYFDMPGVANPKVKSWGVIGLPDPQQLGRYPQVPRVFFTLHSQTCRFVIVGGTARSRCTVRVTHT